MELNVAPAGNYRIKDKILMAGSGRSGACPHVTMEILSDLIRTNGLETLVGLRANETAKRSWMTYGSDRNALMEEAGYAAVNAAGGFFDKTVTAHIRNFSAGIAAADIARHL